MPKASTAQKKPQAKTAGIMPSAPSPAPEHSAVMTPVEPGLEVIYPELECLEYSTTSENGPVDAELMKSMLDWKTEEQWQKEMMEEHPESKPEAWLFYDDFHCMDTSGKKVRCLNNAGNRPFDMEWCKKLQEMILKGQWAGPLTIPGETINGEAIRISRYGRFTSGQHQGTALVLAQELLLKSRQALYYDPADIASEKYPFWYGKDGVVIETYIVTGVSEDPRVLRTVDYNKPRSEADMLYTMEVFKKNTPAERKEMTKMLAAAVDLLWTRTDAKGYRTHPEIVGFIDRHERLLQCVEHLFLENKPQDVGTKKRLEGETKEQQEVRLALQAAQGGRRISKLRLNPGDCAALMYLMGSSGTGESESDAYRNMCPPLEGVLDWERWDKASEFWTMLAGNQKFRPVRTALNRLVESKTDNEEGDNQGLGGRADEKLAILAQAWKTFHDHPDDTDDDNPPFPYEIDTETNLLVSDDLIPPDGALSLCYTNKDDKGALLPEGKIKLMNVADFFGIDCPERTKSAAQAAAPPMPTAPTPEEIEERAEAERARRELEADAKKEKSKKRPIVRKP